ncbi:hypothetical protein H70357_24535 [Paenibacillus sp. FSL H7-0357]|uniref:hypothetical protein n=1 Tax=Paenibacillus sp. FSL H7-0357 TaxID=1536774 RepID=UPI0004F7596A|nr:hypothetical protein [Paenibacillus sp. FSL H7-0357]AIQ19527.1 hypothetical protein H70357_24535 [Paenibacillus sp. FSL H7-0357]
MNVSSIGIKKAGSASQQFLTNLFVVTATVDPASLATVTGAVTAAITATGAALGDRVELFPPADMQGVMAFGYVSAANAVKISFFNPTAGTIDLASGTWTIHVIRK